MLNEITVSKVPSDQAFPYSPEIPFTTAQRLGGLESCFCVFGYLPLDGNLGMGPGYISTPCSCSCISHGNSHPKNFF